MKVPQIPTYAGVNKFITEFKRFDTGQVVRTFTNGYCYWFAHILHTRFPEDSEIVYYHAGNHFACRIKTRIFDITGDITDKNLFFESWEDFKKHTPKEEVNRVIRYCIDKTGI